MSNITQLVEQHIREHESRLKHIDELLERARKIMAEQPKYAESGSRLADIERERDKLANRLDKLRLQSLHDWQDEELEKAGPLAMWDAVSMQLEKLVETIER